VNDRVLCERRELADRARRLPDDRATGTRAVAHDGARHAPPRPAGKVAITLTSGRKRISGALVSVQGHVRSVKTRSSGKRGTVRLRVKATKKGVERFTATKRGYATATTTLRVR
jgi:hypothetical protein